MDLKILWYVLLKEKLKLGSDEYHSLQNNLDPALITKNKDKVICSMNRLKEVMNQRVQHKNNFMNLLELFHYKKVQYRKTFFQKYPEHSNRQDPYFSVAEKKRIESIESQLEMYKVMNLINSRMKKTEDWSDVHDVLPKEFRPEDPMSLLTVFDDDTRITPVLNELRMARKNFLLVLEKMKHEETIVKRSQVDKKKIKTLENELIIVEELICLKRTGTFERFEEQRIRTEEKEKELMMKKEQAAKEMKEKKQKKQKSNQKGDTNLDKLAQDLNKSIQEDEEDIVISNKKPSNKKKSVIQKKHFYSVNSSLNEIELLIKKKELQLELKEANKPWDIYSEYHKELSDTIDLFPTSENKVLHRKDLGDHPLVKAQIKAHKNYFQHLINKCSDNPYLALTEYYDKSKEYLNQVKTLIQTKHEGYKKRKLWKVLDEYRKDLQSKENMREKKIKKKQEKNRALEEESKEASKEQSKEIVKTESSSKKIDVEAEVSKFKAIIDESIKENVKMANRELEMEMLYCEMLNGGVQEFEEIDIQSRIVNNEVKEVLLHELAKAEAEEDQPKKKQKREIRFLEYSKSEEGHENVSNLNTGSGSSSNANTETKNTIGSSNLSSQTNKHRHSSSKPISVLSKQEKNMVDTLKQKTSLMNTLPLFVNNPDQFQPRQKKQLINAIQKGRSKAAKTIFEKELGAMSQQADLVKADYESELANLKKEGNESYRENQLKKLFSEKKKKEVSDEVLALNIIKDRARKNPVIKKVISSMLRTEWINEKREKSKEVGEMIRKKESETEKEIEGDKKEGKEEELYTGEVNTENPEYDPRYLKIVENSPAKNVSELVNDYRYKKIQVFLRTRAQAVNNQRKKQGKSLNPNKNI
eukprot:CAMPEP_0170517404 /NCGR_PEP_ID=MMETSP0209-20121228/3411_1 /TAXON_ID=665100 ORGANISM="Litonotus pictus, Strain P1" /NCGR_SAMPLE_ID=MMETSP0209 /ASSEMBLY_ACC=CAM_ASM_000301 /LENGTH=868 /DNA_ID=CAMNT_0010802645 /DNA_START=201 /DNA_END=2807 /DNA_ORIENTATION=-